MTFKSQSFSAAELSAVSEVAFGAVNRVAPTLKANFGGPEYATKGGNERDWVTHWDEWAEQEIKAELTSFSTEIGFLGEESGSDGNGDVYWTVDPIDGTSHFVRGNELTSTMISLVDHDVPVVAIIHDFVKGVAFSAIAGQGAYRNGQKRLAVSSRTLATSFVEVYTDRSEAGALLQQEVEATGSYLLRNQSTGYTMTTVARGGTEAFITLRNPYAAAWDVAPGALLIHEAGGIVRNVGKADYAVSNPDFVAANKATFDRLAEIARINSLPPAA